MFQVYKDKTKLCRETSLTIAAGGWLWVLLTTSLVSPQQYHHGVRDGNNAGWSDNKQNE